MDDAILMSRTFFFLENCFALISLRGSRRPMFKYYTYVRIYILYMVWYNIIFGRKKQKTNTLPNIRCRTKGDCIREYHGQHCITYDQYYSCEPKMEMASVVFFFRRKNSWSVSVYKMERKSEPKSNGFSVKNRKGRSVLDVFSLNRPRPLKSRFSV